MKKILSLFLLVTSFALGQNPSYTPNFGFELPGYGTTNWQVPLNYNFALLDKVLSGNSSVNISTWNISTTYQVGNLVIYNGTGYISLADANTGNLPTNTTWWTNTLGGGGSGGNTTSSALNPGCLPLANGANSIVTSLFCDNGTNGAYNGAGGFAIPSSGSFQIGPDTFMWRGGSGIINVGTSPTLVNGQISAGTGFYGSLLVSGQATIGAIQNGVPGLPITLNQSGGGALAVVINGGTDLNGAVEANGSYGTSGLVLSSNGPGNPVSWVSNSGGGGTTNTICSGTIALGTSAIASGAAATAVTATCSTLASTDNIMLDFAADPTSTTGYIPSVGGMLTIIKLPTANTINVKVVNNTAASITPGSVTMNYRVVR